jgi:hypothetical protein
VFHVLKTALIARITFLEHAIFVMKVIRWHRRAIVLTNVMPV